MAQNINILLGKITYTRADYTALRAYVQRVPVGTIANLYYSEDSPQLLNGLERFLLDMRSDLIERCIENNPSAAQALQHARAGGQITLAALDILIRMADVPKPVPKRSDSIAQWLRPKTAAALKLEGVQTVDALMSLIGRRGSTWWRGVPRIGAGRASVIVAWLRKNEVSLGPLKVVTLINDSQSAPVDLQFNHTGVLPPLARLRVPTDLDGSCGSNRAARHSDIFANTDIDAIQSYLARFADRPDTLRAYTREVERFYFWCLLELRKPLSSVNSADCERYRLFLQSPSPTFVGPRTKRSSPHWRPFCSSQLKLESQDFAVRAVIAMFKFLVSRSYLAGDPWIRTSPRSSGVPAQTGGTGSLPALPAWLPEIWDRLLKRLRDVCGEEVESQSRIAFAAISLVADVGLSRKEMIVARREHLVGHPLSSGVSVLRVAGFKGRPREVVLAPHVVGVLRAHWLDRGLDFDCESASGPLIAPLIIPPLNSSQRRHASADQAGYTADGIYKVITKALRQVANGLAAEFPDEASSIVQVGDMGPRLIRSMLECRLKAAGAHPIDIAQLLGRKQIP